MFTFTFYISVRRIDTTIYQYVYLAILSGEIHYLSSYNVVQKIVSDVSTFTLNNTSTTALYLYELVRRYSKLCRFVHKYKRCHFVQILQRLFAN